VDGLNYDQTADKTDDGRVTGICLLAAHCDAFEPFEFADCLFDTRPEFIEAFRKKFSSLLGVFKDGSSDQRGLKPANRCTDTGHGW